MDETDTLLEFLLLLILLSKVTWLLSLITHFINREYVRDYRKHEDKLIFIEEWSHDIFTFLIGVLMIYLFNHLTRSKVCLSGHVKNYLYSFGILSCFGIIQKIFHEYYFHEKISQV